MSKFIRLRKFLLTLPVAMLAVFGLFGNVMASSTVYTVRPGDTLCEIGKQFNVPCKDMVANFPQSNPNLIHPGDKFEFGRADGLLGGLVSKPYTFTPNTVISSAQINSDFDTLYTLVNGNIDNANIKTAAGILASKISGTAIVSTGQTAQSIYSTTTIYGGLIVSSTSNYFRVPVMTLAQRDALTGLEGGIIIYVSDSGQFYIREGGSWAAISPAAETATANSTTKGIVEEATNAEVEAGTTTGGTGARLYLNPSSWLEYADVNLSNNLGVGENVSAFNVLYVSTTGSYYIAHANVQSEVDKIAGVSLETVTSGNYPRVYFPGSIIYGTSGMTTGSLVYLSDTGTASTTAGTIRKVIGVALGTNVWQFNVMPEQTNSNPISSTANTIPTLNTSSTLSVGFMGRPFGDCSDGNVTISASTTLTRDMHYNSVTINAGVIVTTSNWVIYSCTSVTNNGTIVNSGGAGGNGGNPTGGTAGAGVTGGSLTGGFAGQAGGAGGTTVGVGSAGSAGTSLSHSILATAGAAGGAGGTHGGQAGGAAGAAGAATLEFATFGVSYATNSLQLGAETTLRKIHAVYGETSSKVTSAPGSGSGGGGGVNGVGGNFGGGGGGSGGAGGPIYIAAPTITNNGSVSSTGGNGGNGGAGSVGAAGGGGGGGNGGLVIFVYNTFSGNAAGVTGGTGGTGNASGANGTVGNFIKVKLPYLTF